MIDRDRHYYGHIPRRKVQEGMATTPSTFQRVDGEDACVAAKRFFGLDPIAEVDIFLLRSRKYSKMRDARTEQEKQEIQEHYYAIMGQPPAPVVEEIKEDIRARIPQVPLNIPTPEPVAPTPAVVRNVPSPADLLDLAELSPQEMRKRETLEQQLLNLDELLRVYRESEVLSSTLSQMRQIRDAIGAINSNLSGDLFWVSQAQRNWLVDNLSQLNTSGIVGGLLVGEYGSIVAPLVDAKAAIFRKLEIPLPVGHGQVRVTRSSSPHGGYILETEPVE